MKKTLLWIAGVLVVLLVGLLLARNIIARKSVEAGVQKVTGFPLEVGSLDVGLFSSRIQARGIKLLNTPEFPERIFVDLPRLYVDYRLGSMLSGAPHVNELSVELRQLVIVRNSKGESNVQKLKGIGSSGDHTGATTNKTSAKYRVDTLHVEVGTVVVKDFSGSKPTERTIPVNLNETYHNITEGTDINRLVLLTVLKRVNLPELGINVADLTKGLGNVTTAAGDLLKQSAGALEKSGKELLEGIKGVVPGQKK